MAHQSDNVQSVFAGCFLFFGNYFRMRIGVLFMFYKPAVGFVTPQHKIRVVKSLESTITQERSWGENQLLNCHITQIRLLNFGDILYCNFRFLFLFCT